MKLNLEAKTNEQKIVKEYLENHVNEFLADKINNGVTITKDNKELVNKKNLDGFFSFANSEARKLAEKGAQCACVKDAIVFGWAMHYFEEDSIEGTLYEQDGTPYKQQVPARAIKPSKIIEAPKPKSNQISLFDSMLEDKKEENKASKNEPVKPNIVNPLIAKYYDAKKQYPDHILVMRLGDFYEAFDDDAKTLAKELELVLTGRDCGNGERTPMVGFPYHCSEVYFNKIKTTHKLAILENNQVIAYNNDAEIIDDDEEDIEELSVEEMKKFDGDIDESLGEKPLTENDILLNKLYHIFGDTAVYMGR